MTINFNLAQAIGLIAMSLWAGSFVTKSNKRLNQIWAVANVFWVSHFALLGALAGAANAVVNILRSVGILCFTNPRHRLYLMVTLVCLYVVANLPFIHTITDIFPLIASLLSCWAFYVVSVLLSRWLLIASSSSYLIYGLVHHSIGQTLAAFISIVIGSITIARLWRDHKLNAEKEPIS